MHAHMQQGASGGNLGLASHYSESKTVLMYKLLMHVQLYYGMFHIYTAINTPADLRCRMTQENKAAFNGTKPALQKQVPEHSLGIFHAPCKAVVQQDKANHPLGSFLQDDYL